MKVRVVVTGRSYHASSNLPREIEVPDGTTIAAAIDQLEQQLEQGETFPASCLVAVSGQHLGTRGALPDQQLRDNDELMLVAPVAGG